MASEGEVKTTLRVPAGLWRRARIEALRRGISVNKLVQAALEREVKG